MRDQYYFQTKMSQPDISSISQWETAFRTASAGCSIGVNADEVRRDKFLFGLNDSFSLFREDIFYQEIMI